MRTEKSVAAFASDPIFDNSRKPTTKMIKRARFWKAWKERQEAKAKNSLALPSDVPTMPSGGEKCG